MEKSIRPAYRKSVPRKRILKQLESFATVPEPKYGDSFRKVKERFPALLKSLGLPSERADIRAAAILSRCRMDINAGNLSTVKLLDSKLTSLMKSFHPKIAICLICEGRNPLEMSIDEIQAYIDSSRDLYGEEWSPSNILDAASGVEPVVRSALISLYKALRLVQRDEGAALGFALKSGNMSKLGAFLNAASNIDDNVDITIDDESLINEPIIHENSIRAEIERACAYCRTLLTT
ncbi:MAG: DUF6240 domain-containing protein [Clostridiales bacterium]|jgi:hypothetical protein|nr:DUF6240 domain-containing protein [Clostridiales bacterium]